MPAPMKLATKLPTGPVVHALAQAMTERPLASRLIVLEVDAPRADLSYTPDGDEVRIPIAAINSLAWITAPEDCTAVRLAARRAYDARTAQPALTDSTDEAEVDEASDGDFGDLCACGHPWEDHDCDDHHCCVSHEEESFDENGVADDIVEINCPCEQFVKVPAPDPGLCECGHLLDYHEDQGACASCDCAQFARKPLTDDPELVDEFGESLVGLLDAIETNDGPAVVQRFGDVLLEHAQSLASSFNVGTSLELITPHGSVVVDGTRAPK